MNRWDIINALIEKHNYKSYLEIGYYKGWSFDQIKCEHKTAVDPNPCKDSNQQLIGKGKYIGEPFGYSEGRANILYKMTSNEFFEEYASGFIYDIVFIDGLHEASQVEKDINNSLRYLKAGGTIVLHDCNPPKYEHTTTGIDGCWTGDTYKAFVKFRLQHPEYESYTVDTDWGCGVITDKLIEDWTVDIPIEAVLPMLEWDYFNTYRKYLLGLISVEEFKTKINERVTDNLRPA